MQSKQSITASAALFVLVAVAYAVLPARAKDEKLKPEELITKNLQSIGAADKLKAIKSRTTSGAAQVTFRVGGAGMMSGKGNILSSGNAARLGFLFSSL